MVSSSVMRPSASLHSVHSPPGGESSGPDRGLTLPLREAGERSHERNHQPSNHLPAGAAGGPADRDLPDRPRLLRRQRRAAVRAAGPGRRRHRPPVAGRRLRTHLRRPPAGGQPARRPLGPPADVPARHRTVRAQLGHLRLRTRREHAARRPARPGRLGGHGRPHRALPHRRRVRRPAAGPRARRLRHGHGRGRRLRPADRRAADPPRHRRLRLAVDLPGQRADRHRRPRRRAAAAAGHPGRHPAPGRRRDRPRGRRR